MKKLIAFLLLAVAASFSAQAQVTSSLGLLYAPDVDDLELGALVASFGYRLDLENGFSVQPEVRGGIGVIDDRFGVPGFGRADVDLSNIFGFTLRGQYDVANGAYFFAQPTYQRIELDVDLPAGAPAGIDFDDNAWEWGIEGGLGFRFNEKFGIEASYGVIDNDEVLNFALRTWF